LRSGACRTQERQFRFYHFNERILLSRASCCRGLQTEESFAAWQNFATSTLQEVMDRSGHDRRDSDDDGRVAAAGVDGAAAAGTTVPSPQRHQQQQQVPRSVSVSADSSSASNTRLQQQGNSQGRRGSFDPLDLSGSERKRATPGGSRLVRWAAALAGGKKSDSPPPRAASSGNKQHRRAEAGSKAVEPSTHTPPIDGGGTDIGGGGSDAGEPPPAGGLPEGSLFTSSPLRHRFRSARRGLTSSGWSSSSTSSAAGWISG
ncbi:unnamed protein product, partial [Ectocarpus fasciculatus]